MPTSPRSSTVKAGTSAPLLTDNDADDDVDDADADAVAGDGDDGDEDGDAAVVDVSLLCTEDDDTSFISGADDDVAVAES